MIFSKKTKPSQADGKADSTVDSKLQETLGATATEGANEASNLPAKSLGQRVSDKVSAPFQGLNQRLQKKLRTTAIERARTRILIAGQIPENLPAETLEIVVREEEDKLKSQIKEKGLLFVVASLGLGWWL